MNISTYSAMESSDFHNLAAKIVSAVYAIISLGVLSNVIVAVVVGNIFLKLGSTLPNRHMLVYVLALCIVDALVLGTLPMLIVQIYLQKWIFGQTLCTIYWTIDSINKTLSTFILTCLSFDRYLAVRFPHRCMNIRTVRGAGYILFCCVLFAALLLMPVYLHTEITYVDIGDTADDDTNQSVLSEVPTCAFVGQSSFIFTIFFLCYFVPFACMSIFYGNMLARLRDRSKKLGLRQGRVRRVTTKTLTLVISYFIFWTPYWTMTLCDVIADMMRNEKEYWNLGEVMDENIEIPLQGNCTVPDDREEEENSWNAATFILMYVVHSGCYLNSAINPILYALLNRELRRQHCAAMNVSARRGSGSTIIFSNNAYAANGIRKYSQACVTEHRSSPYSRRQIPREGREQHRASDHPTILNGLLSPHRKFSSQTSSRASIGHIENGPGNVERTMTRWPWSRWVGNEKNGACKEQRSLSGGYENLAVKRISGHMMVRSTGRQILSLKCCDEFKDLVNVHGEVSL